ncbi:MAG: hypothetical protein JF601_12285, partial [Acidobacteria bacterium]|nr:hypothetical protein [Acidobacteriota bacterium]
YDITGWTLSYQMGVRVDRVEEAVNVATEPVAVAPVPTIAVPPAAGMYAIDPRANDEFIAVNRLLKAGDIVSRTPSPVTIAGVEWPAGTFLVASGTATSARIEQIVQTLGVGVVSDTGRTGVGLVSDPGAWRVRAPRIGLYHGWGGNMDEGWTRWLLEQFEFPYTSMLDRDVRGGNLRAKFDVILLPDATYDQMLNGLPAGSMPEGYTGGMTAKGVSNLADFVNQGGTLVAMDRAGELPLTAFSLPIRNVTADQRDTDFYVPGSILRITVDPTHPVAYGLPAEAAAFFVHSPAFAVGGPSGQSPVPTIPDSIHIVALYPESNILMSGWMLGETVIARRAAVVEAAVGKGRVVLLGFRSEHRGQTHGTYKFLFNSLLLATSESAR